MLLPNFFHVVQSLYLHSFFFLNEELAQEWFNSKRELRAGLGGSGKYTDYKRKKQKNRISRGINARSKLLGKKT